MTTNKPNTTNPQPVQSDSDISSLKSMVEAQQVQIEQLMKTLAETQSTASKTNEEFNLFKADPEAIEKVRAMREDKREIMRKRLMAQPVIRMYLPLEGSEKIGAIHPVQLNGFRMDIPKGVYVDVPEQVADILRDSFQQTESAGKAFRLDLRKNTMKDGISYEEALN